MALPPNNDDIYIREEKRSALLFVFAKIIGIFIGLGFLLYGLLAKDQTPTSTLTWTAIGLLTGFIVDRAADAWSSYQIRVNEQKDIKQILDVTSENYSRLAQQIRQINTSVSGKMIVECLGSGNRMYSVAEELASSAIKIRNTFVGIDESYTSSSDVIKIYNLFFKRPDTTWYDIVSINELFSGRYDKISKPEIKRERMHEIVVLRHSIPLINFTIFSFAGDRKDEVLFGWAYGRSYGVNKVFLTNDTDIVTMFETLFDILWYKKRMAHIIVNYEAEGAARLLSKSTSKTVDKQGFWYTQSYTNKTLRTTAVFHINFVGGVPIIDGIVADAKAQKIIEEISHRSSHQIDHSAEKIYVEYESDRELNRVKGFVLYKFAKHLGRDIVSGLVLDERIGGVAYIMGLRVNDPRGEIAPDINFLRSVHAKMAADVAALWETSSDWQGPSYQDQLTN